MLIDDDQRLQRLPSDYLADSDVLTEGAGNGALGLSMAASGGFDAVILGIMMLGMNGLAVPQKLRESYAVPVLLLTAKGDETDRIAGLEPGGGTRVEGSLGFGLNLVKRIADVHSGHVLADNLPQGGARVGFSVER